MIVAIEDQEAFEQALADAGDKLVVVEFSASWCGPCSAIAPFFEELAEREENQDIVFLKVDVDDAEDVANFCEIKCMPTFHFYKNGKKIDNFSGSSNEKLEQLLKENRCSE